MLRSMKDHVDESVHSYLAALPPDSRELFDQVHRLILESHPSAHVLRSYKMPTYVVGDRRLHVDAWKHGLSLYGWDHDRDAGFATRHPELDSGKGTLRLPHTVAESIPDDELRDLARAVLNP